MLKAIPDVLSVKAEREGDHWLYRIDYRVGADIRGAVYRAVRETDCELLMLRAEEISLESIYLRITEDTEAELQS